MKMETKLAIEKYADTVRRICFVYLKNYHDAEDVFQNVFLKHALHDAGFESEEHEKAWIIRVAINACKDAIKSLFRKRVISIDELIAEPSYTMPDGREVLEAVLQMSEKYRIVIYLFYYEGYSALEISAMLRKNENTVYTWLSRARKQLKEKIGGESFEG